MFAMPEAIREANVVYRLDDGSLIMDAVPLIANQDLLYYAYELPTEELFGLKTFWSDTDPLPAGHIRWNQALTGRLTTECAQNCADQFEGLPITDGHVDVEPGKRDEVAVGTFLRDAVIDGDKVRTKALIYVAASIVKIDANGSELSIGGMAFMEPNSRRGEAGEPDFFIKRINLNHVALVEEGRAGPEARLLNHRASLAHKQKEVPHMKVTINGVEIEVPDVAVNHYAGQMSNLEGQVATLTTTNSELTNSVASLTTERDTATGALAAAQTELANAQAEVTRLSEVDATAEATRIANEHAAFADEAQRLGHADPLTLGDYDRTAIMRTVLNARGGTFAEDASVDVLNGAWQFAVANAGSGTRSVIDNRQPAPAAPLANVAAGADAAVRASYFGGAPKKKED